MFIHRVPAKITELFPKLHWQVSNPVGGANGIYFTFDDGPTPGVTEWVLDCLKEHQAKASFFCIGKNLVAHPRLAHRLHEAGHSVGNHTQHHLSVWQHAWSNYHADALQAQTCLKDLGLPSVGFRPPYGRMSPSLYACQDFGPIYMWSVLTGDYRSDLNVSKVLQACLPGLRAGDIVVFHDSLKAELQMKRLLPAFLAHCQERSLTPMAL